MAFEHAYSLTDRLLHRLAFATTRSQMELGDLEDRLFAGQTKNITASRPVFITGLPRAGTTLLLELCVAVGGFASHTYRDMPFVLLPLLWNGLTRRFHTSATRIERAHGDGMEVDVDSPEAFEEMVWKTAWPAHYPGDRIVPWRKFAGSDATFRAAFHAHMCKIIAVRRQNSTAAARYLSKNNANIARIDWLLGAFPDASIVLPIRDPLQHALSLHRQHVNFTAIHRRDAFARAYMAGIGHFDFGDNLRPIDFGGWLATARYRDPTDLGFWLEYWLAAYSHVLTHRDERIHFLLYDQLCAEPAAGLARLAEFLTLDDASALVAQQTEIQPLSHRDVDTGALDADLVARAQEVFTRCQTIADDTTRSPSAQ